MLLSLGFRPGWLEPDRTWQLAAVTSLAMADAAEALTGLPVGAIRLKWPNDLVIEGELSGYRKVAGVLGETEGLGTDDPRVVVGLGINVDWPAADFPRELAQSMMSLREASHAQPIDRSRLLDSFVERLESRVDELRAGRFAAVAWSDRQLTTGRTVRLEHPDRNETLRAVGVDALSGALVVEDLDAADGRREVLVGEVNHVRLADPAGAVV